MRRHATLIWAVMAGFLAFAVSLPLDHVCFDNTSDGSASGCSTFRSVSPAASGHVFPARLPVQKDDTCAACLWSHTLILDQEPLRLALVRAVAPNPQHIYALPIPRAVFLESTSKRGPPADFLN